MNFTSKMLVIAAATVLSLGAFALTPARAQSAMDQLQGAAQSSQQAAQQADQVDKEDPDSLTGPAESAKDESGNCFDTSSCGDTSSNDDSSDGNQ
jgi:hemolysin activation/secretion protein